MGPVQRVEALPSSSVDTPSPVAASKGSLESDVDAEISLEGRRGVGIGVAIPEGSSNVDCASKATFSRDAEGESARNMDQSGDEFNILQRPGEGETTEEHVTRSETETMQQARDGGDGGDDLDSLASSPAPAATFDIESVKGDQRFEQLVEIVECVASGLSVSDISKVSQIYRSTTNSTCLTMLRSSHEKSLCPSCPGESKGGYFLFVLVILSVLDLMLGRVGCEWRCCCLPEMGLPFLLQRKEETG